MLVYFVHSESDDDDERRHYPRHKVARRYDGAYRDGQSGNYGPQYLEHSEPRHSHRPSKLYTLRSVNSSWQEINVYVDKMRRTLISDM